MTSTSVSAFRPARKKAGHAPSPVPPRGRAGARSAQGAVPASAGALGNTRNIFPPPSFDAVIRGQRRARRYLLRDVLWHKSSLRRVQKCGRVSISDDGSVEMADNGGVAHYRGLATCGSIWACPVCSAKIRNTRAQEIATAAGNWHRAGNTVLMVTLTAPHDLGMPLAPLLKTISKSFSSVIAGRPWLRLKETVPVAGTIRSVEVTHGPNGWHPHLHVLVFIDGQAGAHQLAALGMHVRSKWSGFITRAGYRPPSDLHGVKIDVCTSAAEAGLYIAKTQDGKSPGNELARSDMKSGRDGHRTPFQVLGEIADTGDLDGLALWHEYEKATRRHQAITWSKGLRKLLLDAEPERSDEEIAAEEIGGDAVLSLSARAWWIVTLNLGLGTRLLDAFERGGQAEALTVAADYGLVPDPAASGPVPRLVSA